MRTKIVFRTTLQHRLNKKTTFVEKSDQRYSHPCKSCTEKGNLKKLYFNKYDGNHCKHIWQKSRDENMRSNISNEKTLAANPMEPVTGHWRQHIGASSEASESVIRDHKGWKRPLSPESEATSSGSGSSTLDQWQGRKQSGNGDTHSKSVNTAAYSESNRGPEFSEQFKYEIQNELKRIPHRKRVKFNI